MNPELIPPSSYAVPKPQDPWQSLSKATKEILQLQQENDKLRAAKQIVIPSGEEIKARVDIHHQPPNVVGHQSHTATVEVTHYHDIIQRQAAELSQLKQQVAESSTQFHRQVAQLESQLFVKDSTHGQKMMFLETQLKTVTEEKEVQRKRHAEERVLLEQAHMSSMQDLQEKLQYAEKAALEETSLLKSQLHDCERVSEQLQQKYDDRVKETGVLLAEQQQTISQLKTYVTETKSSQSSEVWKMEMDKLQKQLLQREREKSGLDTEMQLLKIRLSSQNDILQIQENELCKLKDPTEDKKKQCLLTRWREKVYELLVQLKCAGIVQEEAERKYHNKVENLQTQLSSSQSQTKVLKCSLVDMQAQLDLQTNQIKALQMELTSAQQLAIDLDDRAQQAREAAQGLAQMANSVFEKYLETEMVLQKVMTTFSGYSQRIAFASGRVQVLQSQFARKEALLRLQIEDATREKPTRDTDPLAAQSAECEQMQTELERVTSERDALAQQVKRDAQTLDNRITEAKNQVADEVTQLQQRLEELGEALDCKSQRCDLLNDQMLSVQEKLAESRETVEGLTEELRKAHLHTEKEVEKALGVVQCQQTDQLAEMEAKLNEARREHTKAVVSLRQMERQVARDKERANERVTTLEGHYKTELEKLQDRLRNMEKERNMLMTTIRQEGLVGRLKADRPPPATGLPGTEERGDAGYRGDDGCHGDGDHGIVTSHFRPFAGDTDSSCQQEEPLHVVIDDLRSLTAAVMAEDEMTLTETPDP